MASLLKQASANSSPWLFACTLLACCCNVGCKPDKAAKPAPQSRATQATGPTALENAAGSALDANASSKSGAATGTPKRDTRKQPVADSEGRTAAEISAALYQEITDDALKSAVYRNGEEAGVSSIVESLGGGVGVADYDRDGRVDILVPGGGQFGLPDKCEGLPAHLLRNLDQLRFASVASESRIDAVSHYTHGVAVADFDNDGFSDILLTGYGGLQLFQNLGDGTFAEVTSSVQLGDTAWSSSAAWGDFNRDGNLDLYVCHYVNWSFQHHPYCPGPDANRREICSPRDFEGLDDVLYLSDGEGHFHDASKQWGLVANGKGLGVVVGDVTADGLPDVYVGNDTTENFLYVNRGDHFEEIAQAAGVAVDDEGIPNGSMGVELADFNGDLLPDLWAANYERESFALYRNEGQGFFLHVSRPLGVTALGGLFVGFGTVFVDADGDGDLDVVVANGHVIKYPEFSERQQQPLLLINGRTRMTRRAFPAEHYFERKHEARGLAKADFDDDGHLDLIFSHMNAPPTLLRSTLTDQNRTLVIEPIGTSSNRDGIGTRAVLVCDEGKLLRTINGGGSYLSSSQAILQFEIPAGWHPHEVTIEWPSGTKQQVPLNDATEKQLTLLEPSAAAE